jgi:Dehydrogenases with different specificities (related to short-chain alcohol dehydrogenases)
MQKKDYSIKAVVIGSGNLYNNIINRLLLENAIVIAATSKYREIDILKKGQVHCNSKLITFLADISDYKRAAEFLDEIIAKYGKIDLAVGIFDSSYFIPDSDCLFVDMNCNEFEQLINHNIINYFLVCRVLLHAMKNAKQGICVTVSNLNGVAEKIKAHTSVIVSIVEKMQNKIAEIFSNEVNALPSSSLKYYHLPVRSLSGQLAEQEFNNVSGHIVDLLNRQNEVEHNYFNYKYKNRRND